MYTPIYIYYFRYLIYYTENPPIPPVEERMKENTLFMMMSRNIIKGAYIIYFLYFIIGTFELLVIPFIALYRETCICLKRYDKTRKILKLKHNNVFFNYLKTRNILTIFLFRKWKIWSFGVKSFFLQFLVDFFWEAKMFRIQRVLSTANKNSFLLKRTKMKKKILIYSEHPFVNPDLTRRMNPA